MKSSLQKLFPQVPIKHAYCYIVKYSAKLMMNKPQMVQYFIPAWISTQKFRCLSVAHLNYPNYFDLNLAMI